MANEAAWLMKPQGNVEIGPTDLYTPGPNEVLVKIESIPFIQIDAKIQKYSALPVPYPHILGFSLAGVVEKVGPSVASVKVGDRVVAYKAGRHNRYSACQKYALAGEGPLSKLDPSTSLDDASVAMANSATIVSALSICLGLERPPLSGKAKPNGKKIFIYGGSSSCGKYAVKYASDAGYEVITTSSPTNKAITQKHNPAHIIDHTLPSEKLVAEIKSHGPYHAIFDAIGSLEATAVLVAVLADTGGSYHTTLPPFGVEQIPENVQRTFASYPDLFGQSENQDLAAWFYKEYFPQGLKNGQILPSKIARKGGGLKSVQEVLDVMLGELATRFVVNPQD